MVIKDRRKARESQQQPALGNWAVFQLCTMRAVQASNWRPTDPLTVRGVSAVADSTHRWMRGVGPLLNSLRPQAPQHCPAAARIAVPQAASVRNFRRPPKTLPMAAMPAVAVPEVVAAAATAQAASSVASPIGDRKLRLLCLHGYMQNAEVFRSRIGSLRKALKSRVEFFFLDAPYPTSPADKQSPDDSGSTNDSQGRSWWRWTDLEPGTRPSEAARYSGWEASQAAIQAALKEHVPIDGLLGFSQGATAAALYLAHTQPPLPQEEEEEDRMAGGEQQQRWQQRPDLLRIAVIIAGFLPRDTSYTAVLQQSCLALPSLHVHGAADALVPEDRSAGLWLCFAQHSARTFKHPGAHMVPTCSGAFKQLLQELLDVAKEGRVQEWQVAAAVADAGGGGSSMGARGEQASVAAEGS